MPEQIAEIGAIVDEYSFDWEEQLRFAAERNISASVRMVSMGADEAKLAALDTLANAQFGTRLQELKDARTVRHISALSDDELDRYFSAAKYLGVRFVDVAAGVGKQYFGEPNHEQQFREALEGTVRVLLAAEKKGFFIPMVRTFDFYPGTKAQIATKKPETERYRETALRYCIEMINRFTGIGRIAAFEVEVGLYGCDGQALIDHWREIRNATTKPALLYFDAANIVRQGKNSFENYLLMLPGIGGLHIKDCVANHRIPDGISLEDAGWPHTVCGNGAGDYASIFSHIASRGQETIQVNRKKAGLDPVIPFILEPHLRFQTAVGGYTGSLYDKALRTLVKELKNAEISYQNVNLR